MSGFSSGKYAFGFCDRTGLRYPLDELVEERVNGTLTGLRVGYDVADEDHPQNFTGRVITDDPRPLKNPRPDTAIESLHGFNPVWNPAQDLITSVGTVTVTTN